MKMTVVGSSSKGNAYLLTASNGETLQLEAGCPVDDVYKAMNFNISGLVGVCVTHEHLDHARYVKQYLDRGRRVLALRDVFDGIENRSYCTLIESMHGYAVGRFKILPVRVHHDVPCVGFVIDHPEMGRLLFATDTMMLEYRFDGLNHIMIEANYADEILNENVDAGIVPAILRDRLMTTHMSIGNAINLLRANDLSAVNEIVLIHLSDNNSDADEFRERVVKATGKPVYIASKRLEVEFNKEIY